MSREILDIIFFIINEHVTYVHGNSDHDLNMKILTF